jgi:membrane-associated protein
MLKNLSPWQRSAFRLLAGACLLTFVWVICHDAALAQGSIGVVEPVDDGFWGNLFRDIFTFDTKALMRTLGKPEFAWPAFIAINVIVFVETGLLLGFFLPGDSLLVITGLICANQDCQWNLPLLLVSLSASAIVGDSVGYSIGYKTGPAIFNRERSFFFNKDHLLKAQQFYERHGGKTIILARFMPILRTFAPVVAGVGKMEYRSFLFFNVIGGVSWVFSMVLAGRFLPELLNPMLSGAFGVDIAVQDHIEKVVIIVVLLSIAPMIFAWLKHKLLGKTPAPPAEAAATAS